MPSAVIPWSFFTFSSSFFDTDDFVINDTAVKFNLSFTGAAQKSGAAALPFEMRPTANQPAALIGQMRQFYLKLPFAGLGSFSENLKNQRRPVNNLNP